jgi:hypothetical protein
MVAWHLSNVFLVMTRLLLLVAVMLTYGHVQGQQFLKQDYNFIGRGIGTTKLCQSHDTLYLFRDYLGLKSVRSNALAPPKQMGQHFKIVAYTKSGNFDILKVECLDTLPLAFISCPETRYSLIILNHLDSKSVGYLSRRSGATKAEIDTATVGAAELRNSFYLLQRCLRKGTGSEKENHNKRASPRNC